MEITNFVSDLIITDITSQMVSLKFCL